MSHVVNPPPQLRIPSKFLAEPEIRSFFEQQNYIIFQLWNRTGGPEDAIAELETSDATNEVIESASIDEILNDIEDIAQQTPETQKYISTTINTNYTAHAYEFIAATAPLTVKLPEYPGEDDIVIVLNVNGCKIITDGNGNTINSETTVISYKKNTTINYQYFAELGAWYMR